MGEKPTLTFPTVTPGGRMVCVVVTPENHGADVIRLGALQEAILSAVNAYDDNPAVNKHCFVLSSREQFRDRPMEISTGMIEIRRMAVNW